MMRCAWTRLLCLLLLCAAMPAYADPAADPARAPFPAGRYRLDPLHSRIAWSVDHLGFSTFRGLIPRVGGTLLIDPSDPVAARLDVAVPMAGITSLDPALDLRLHGAQFFAVARYPTASYRASRLVVTGARTARLDGDLTLCGVTHPVAMNVRLERAGTDPVDGRLTLGFDGTMTVRRSQFGVVAYTPLVGDDVALDLEAELTPDSGAAKP